MCGIMTGIHKIAIVVAVTIANSVSLLTESFCTAAPPFCIPLGTQ